MQTFLRPIAVAALAAGICLATDSRASNVSITIQAQAPGRIISPDLFGVFFEDINYAADGGLYAELIQNRSFEYQATDNPAWNPLTGWELTARDGTQGSLFVDAGDPIHPNNPHYAVLHVSQPGDGVGLRNAGFDGIPLRAGECYDVSLFAKHLYSGERWSRDANQGSPAPLIVRFESPGGESLGEARLEAPGREWTRLAATITAGRSDDAARFVVLATAPGGVALDMISVFPRKTFHDRPNGLRPDLAQAIADLKPKFVRFPGGCLVHGNGLGNMYRWKDTIGPVAQRRAQGNIWRYHQTAGLGYFEYFQFCEDIGAKPLPIVAAGVCCQNSGVTQGTGQKGLPMEQMPDYVQEVLDLIEYANGPATSTWGAKRAAAGHPAPFKLEYLGVGNEDRITPVFRERFRMICDALKAAHPEITVVGTAGPFPDGEDFEAGWKFARELSVPVVDEHYYQPPRWFLDNSSRYDSYDRAGPKVYVGEYAAHDDHRRNTLRSALAEAAYMTALERNGDVVRMASYAPLLGKLGRCQWNPDLIYFTNTAVFPSVNYYVQQLFSTNAGDRWLPFTMTPDAQAAGLAFSAVRDTRSGDLILKIVNPGATPAPLHLELAGAENLAAHALKTVLTGDPLAVNEGDHPARLLPVAARIPAGPAFDCESPAYSLTVIRLPPRGTP
jgi:alpha-N-arabinofuranosidase